MSYIRAEEVLPKRINRNYSAICKWKKQYIFPAHLKRSGEVILIQDNI